jgi:3-oxoacyl-[acyl-carrier-protein] synthase III
MTYASISGSGAYLPDTIVTNHDLEERLDTSHDWIVTRTGIHSRRVASSDETTATMAERAARNAIENSGINTQDLDMIIVATCTPDNHFPSVACMLHGALKIKRTIPAFDMSAACSGFIYAMDMAKQYIENNVASHVLIVGSEVMSRAIDWNDRKTCILFGDGAGAIVMSSSNKPGLLASVLHSQGKNSHLLHYANACVNNQDGPQIHMSGNEVFKLAVNTMGSIVEEVLEKASLKQKDIDWLIPHQANMRIIQATAKKLNLSMEQVIVTLHEQGNTSAASIPIALTYGIESGQIKRGDLVLLESFGGGMTWGANIIAY